MTYQSVPAGLASEQFSLWPLREKSVNCPCGSLFLVTWWLNYYDRRRTTMTEKKIRVLVAKPGLDGHDRGAKVIAYSLRDAGFEVIYSGLRQTTDSIVRAAIQEDVDVVGLSILSGAHLALTRRVAEGLKAQGADDVVLLVGGLIPDEDIPALKEIGVKEIFTSGTSINQVVESIKKHVQDGLGFKVQGSRFKVKNQQTINLKPYTLHLTPYSLITVDPTLIP